MLLLHTAGRLQLTLLLFHALSHLSLRFQLRFFAVHHYLHSKWETAPSFLFITWVLAHVHLPRTSMYIITNQTSLQIHLGKISFQRCPTNLTICMARMFQEKQLHLHNQPPKTPTLHLHLTCRHLRLFSFCTFRSQLGMGPFEFCLPKSSSKDQKNQQTSSDRNQALVLV